MTKSKPKCENCNRLSDVVYVGDDGDMGYGDWICLACGVYFYTNNQRAK
ncbi:hypothetical protein [Nostoc sp.]